MHLSHIGVLADVFWHEIKNHADHVILDSFAVMPNHVHGIIILDNNEPATNSTTNSANNFTANSATNVETRHALSLPIQPTPIQIENNAENIINITNDFDGVETKHALSLPMPTQTTKTIGQNRFQNQGKNSISSIIGSYKAAVTKHANRLGYEFAWQTRFHDHIIRDEKSYQRIVNYIESNVLNWKNDKFYG
jgi:REP element-mobilizing transposase RayT